MLQFERYFGIDYSGAETPSSNLKGLRLYAATRAELPVEISPPINTGKFWTRRRLTEWLTNELRQGPPTLVGIDHAFSFPRQYFEIHRLPHDWPAFLEDFQQHWPTDSEHMYVDFIRDGVYGNGAARSGNARWRRMTEERSRAKSVFHFDVPGSVAKSTHAGLPWLLSIRQELKSRVHFWPFDGWTPPSGRSVITEVYPSLWSKTFSTDGRTPDQHDAYSVARWMREADAANSLVTCFHPQLSPEERSLANFEGWILGIA
jgi:hypothetical protein